MEKAMSVFFKKCPSCGNTQYYKRKNALVSAIKKNKVCVKCGHAGEKNSMFGKKHSEETKNVISKNTSRHMKGKPKSDEQKKKMSLSRVGKKHSTETIKKLQSRKLTDNHIEILKKPKSDEVKKKMRISARKRILKGIGARAVPNYNPKACVEIDNLGKQLGYKFQHAMTPEGEFFIKDLFVWVDGYDIINNVVVEYDELHHNWTRFKKKDELRQQDIIEHLKCKFIRIKENKDGSTEVKYIN
jgi:hypothetical protein